MHKYEETIDFLNGQGSEYVYVSFGCVLLTDTSFSYFI